MTDEVQCVGLGAMTSNCTGFVVIHAIAFVSLFYFYATEKDTQ